MASSVRQNYHEGFREFLRITWQVRLPRGQDQHLASHQDPPRGFDRISRCHRAVSCEQFPIPTASLNRSASAGSSFRAIESLNIDEAPRPWSIRSLRAGERSDQGKVRQALLDSLIERVSRQERMLARLPANLGKLAGPDAQLGFFTRCVLIHQGLDPAAVRRAARP